ncbi:formylglycine-generating enzyme family protein [Leptolyngbya sp. NIES-2104]|uniref:formylglycine-generating enzyme family protein n=1 Tax=Leptolyngbya sp. NIES-2104 TaxID=1552121 RepID=UPI0006EC77F7|nr:formylglycine-generating enzyme family protein [Leptolyngbya sp. NIES-2104]GAP94852.1 hypothetical protein NIES2104_13690 [Leptolyngbya sp. NIES-2104]
MPRCPVCQTRSSKAERCVICGWDVQPLSFVTGLIPEVADKEAVRLDWAKRLWSKMQSSQAQLRQLQNQIEELHDRENYLQAQLDQATQEAAILSQDLDQLPKRQLFEPQPEFLPPYLELDRVIPSFEVLPTKPLLLEPFTFETITLTAEGARVEQQTATSLKESLNSDIHLEMVYVPAGQFWMGSEETELGRDLHESPRHRVTIAPFLMSRFPITQAQWKAIAALPKVQRSISLYPAHFEGDDRPVEQVSWCDAIEFCARLVQMTGQPYRLPSEAEWEYACRAGTTTPFHFGETISAELANYDGNYTYGSGVAGGYHQETIPVTAEHSTNGFGLAQMHGNVWEWCADAWHDTYEGAPEDGTVWEEEDVTYRVLRGGAWYCLPELCRSAQRHWNQPDMAGSGIGFRVVCSVPI